MFENGNSKELKHERFGDIVNRKKDIPFINFIKEECDKRGLSLRFDLVDIYNNNEKVIIYTEFFGGMGGVILRPTHAIHKYKSYSDALRDDCEITIDFPKLVENIGDKYDMNSLKETYEKVAILCGSNLLLNEVSPGKVQKAIGEGAKVKPHPLTNQLILDTLNNYLDPSAILDKHLSGFELIKNAKVVYITEQSELALYSILLGKQVEYIDKNNVAFQGCYRSLLKFVKLHENKKDVLNKILNSWRSGVFFEHSNKEDICKYLDYIGGVLNGRA